MVHSATTAAVEVSGVSKCYHIFGRPRDRLLRGIQRVWGGRKAYAREFWALRDIGFRIPKGETVGILGRNGSGKSTLLQIICGTLEPTHGAVHVGGSVGALLELGAGFNPEFTGRENVYMNGAILGLRKEELDAQYEDIAGFADIGEFIDQPVKMYSSGMFVRLAFAVQTCLEPDVLIVDEALSVGDEAFQRKCFAKMEELRRRGTTVLFVSHSAALIVQLCDRALLLDHGELLLDAEPKVVVDLYQKLIYASAAQREEIRSAIRALAAEGKAGGPVAAADAGASTPEQEEEAGEDYDAALVPESTLYYEERGARISDVSIRDGSGRRVNVLERNELYAFHYTVEFTQSCRRVRFAMLVKTVNGLELAAQWSNPVGLELEEVGAGHVYHVEFPLQLPFTAGTYFANAGVVGISGDGDEMMTLHRVVDAAMFRIKSRTRDRSDRYVDITQAGPPRLIRAA